MLIYSLLFAVILASSISFIGRTLDKKDKNRSAQDDAE